MSQLLFSSAAELAARVRAGELSARELVESSLRRIDEREPELGAFTHVAHDDALAAADAIGPGDPRPFAGVPIAIKDNRAVAGMPLTICSDLYDDLVPDYDAFVVRRLRAAGFVIVGKTTLPEMGILPTTEPRRFGPTRNPWSLDRTPGGSSGGSAAAVAGGVVPIAHGNDSGGSLRIPAACCGLFTLKLSRGRTSPGPDGALSLFGGDGVLTRTVADCADAIDALAGYELGDAITALPPGRPYPEAARSEPGRLRIALALTMPLAEGQLDEVSERAARDAAETLAALGHQLEEVEPPWTGGELLSDFTRVFTPPIAREVWIGAQRRGREPLPSDVEPLTWAIWERGRRQTAIVLLSAQARLETVARRVVTALAPYDAVLTPALGKRPVAIGEITGTAPDPWSHYRRSARFTPYTAIANITGQPAATLPLFHAADGLPAAVQLIGRPWREDVLLALSAQLEQALPWRGRRPPG